MPQVPVWVAVAAAAMSGIVGALASALVNAHWSRKLKISEFRQAWIDALREDIAAYVGASRRWNRIYVEVSDLAPNVPQDKHQELFQTANEAFVILWRIRLRINPRDNEFKNQDDLFLDHLEDLLRPEKLTRPNFAVEWQKLASKVVDEGREILKREWQVTKGASPTT